MPSTLIAHRHQYASEALEVNRFIDSLEEVLDQLAIADEERSRVITATTEAFMNALYHGNHEDETKRIHVSLEANPKTRHLAVMVEDEGEGFDPTTVPDPTDGPNLLESTGRGLLIMNMLTDQLTFSERGNVATLSFQLHG